MALDYGNYLLSSSPPGFEYIRLKNFELSSENDGDFPRCQKKDLNVNGFRANANASSHFDNFIKEHCSKIDSEPHKSQWQNIELVDDRTKLTNQKPIDPTRISDWEHAYNCDPQNCSCRSRKRTGKAKSKKVTFADDCGQTLAEVRLMQEPSDVPPELRPEILNHFNSSAPNSVFVKLDATVRLSIDFPQPAANYLAFREKLESGFVSLENAIVKDLQLFGTIKVKNQSYNKRVFVRCTFDGWESYIDHPATYSNSSSTCFDTFSFLIDVPSNLSEEKSIQFAVCFESDGVQFWDNNSGKNYAVTHKVYDSGEKMSGDSSSRGAFALDRQDAWSTFTGWSEEHSSPYW